MTILDTTKLSVLGIGKRKIATLDREGRPVDRYEVRWRAYQRAGGQHDYRRRFDRAADADEFIRRLEAVGLVGASWRLDSDGQPVDALAAIQHPLRSAAQPARPCGPPSWRTVRPHGAALPATDARRGAHVPRLCRRCARSPRRRRPARPATARPSCASTSTKCVRRGQKLVNRRRSRGADAVSSGPRGPRRALNAAPARRP
jgi:hypothetical protein